MTENSPFPRGGGRRQGPPGGPTRGAPTREPAGNGGRAPSGEAEDSSPNLTWIIVVVIALVCAGLGWFVWGNTSPSPTEEDRIEADGIARRKEKEERKRKEKDLEEIRGVLNQFVAGTRDRDFSRVLALMTPAAQDKLVYEAFQAYALCATPESILFTGEAINLASAEMIAAAHGIPTSSANAPWTPEKSREIAAGIKDRAGFVRQVFDLVPIPQDMEVLGAVQDPKLESNRRAVVKIGDRDLELVKQDDNWLLDLGRGGP